MSWGSKYFWIASLYAATVVDPLVRVLNASIVQKARPYWTLGFEPIGPNRLLRAEGQFPQLDPPDEVQAVENDPVMLEADDTTRSKITATAIHTGFANVQASDYQRHKRHYEAGICISATQSQSALFINCLRSIPFGAFMFPSADVTITLNGEQSRD